MTYVGLGSTDYDQYIARTSNLMNRPSNENLLSPLSIFSRFLADHPSKSNQNLHPNNEYGIAAAG
jgi:hypothetical protein